MNLKKLIIYRHDTLFNILNEIKEILNFDLINANEHDIKELIKNLKCDFLIISKIEKKDLKNLLVVDQTPIKINKLTEKINLKFLKERFNFQSDITIGSYKINLNSREISKKGKMLSLTEREINLIIFLNKSVAATKIDKLQKEVWKYVSELETHTVETHIYRLRQKIKEKFNDENFIISSKDGYLIK